LKAALDQMLTHPVPIVAWKTYAALGRLRAGAHDPAGAREAFAQAVAILNQIAGGIHDHALRAVFMNSPKVREVFAGAGETTSD
jgi:hypothetical protein